MLKCDLSGKKGTALVEIHGNVLEITADIIYIISDVYGAIKRENPLEADMFKFIMKRAMDDDDSPIWNLNESGSRQEDGVKGVSVHIPGELRNLLDTLREDEHGE